MSFVLTLLLVFAATPFESTIDAALTAFQNNDSMTAASALDQAYISDPGTFDANNFHYLRGRIAESQNDWTRAREEFKKVASDNPLHALAAWRAARASVKLHDDPAAEQFLASLPKDFPEQLKMQLAREAGSPLALKIYQNSVTREARYQRAKASGDNDELWALIRDNKADDVALDSARVLAPLAAVPRDQMEAGEVFVTHRLFDSAIPLYRLAASDPMVAADARYQIARIHFQQEKYQVAIDEYLAIAKDFEGSDWQMEAESQIASCYWRLGAYRDSEKSYLDYIRKYGHRGMEEAATRNLIDVYRVLGENQKALSTIDRALAESLSASTRQVFVFTKAKILYTEKRYTAALTLFQQLGRMKLRSAPGSATPQEVDYFQALCHSKLGNKTAAETIWRRLASSESSYYGQRSAEKLGKDPLKPLSPAACSSDSSTTLKGIEMDLASLRHPLRTEMAASADPVSELIFLRLWDEAAFWMDRSGTSVPRRALAEISYLGGQYDRSISLADRLPRTESTLPLVYPAGYRNVICSVAGTYKVDPLWLHAIIWQESKYNPEARSGAAARGLMQFIPETAQAVGATIGMPDVGLDKLYDPAVSIQLGAAYWSSLMEKLKSPEAALAAYNGGPDNVQRWLSKSSDPELFVSDIGFVETKKYVMAVFAARAAYGSLVGN
jgi:soluble lytic murein transglycosylase-like protein/TolA-binding protein